MNFFEALKPKKNTYLEGEGVKALVVGPLVEELYLRLPYASYPVMYWQYSEYGSTENCTGEQRRRTTEIDVYCTTRAS